MKQHLSLMDENCTLIKQAFARKELNYTNQIVRLESEIDTLKKSRGGIEECMRSAKLDLQLILDGSGSVKEPNFKIMLQAISSSLISKLNIGEDKVRVAVMRYGATIDNLLLLTDVYDKAILQSRIERIEYFKGGTPTARAMNEALAAFKGAERHGDDVARACLVFTDGEASDPSLVPAASQEWADNDTPVFAVGIKSGISEASLIAITGLTNNSRVLQVDDFDQLAGITTKLLKEVCITIEKKKCKVRIEEYEKLKAECDKMKIDFQIKEKEFKKKEEYFENQTRIYIQKEQEYKREIQELQDEVDGLEQNITNLLSNGSEHTVGILSKYTFVHSRRSWNASQAYCQRMGGNLAVITTLEEERNLMRIIKEKYSWDQAFWIGAKKGEYEVGDWTWLTGETVSLEDPFVWAQENGVYQDGCLVLHPKGFMRKDVKHGGFRGQGCCDDKHAFICETTTVDPICINEKYWDWALWWRRQYSF